MQSSEVENQLCIDNMNLVRRIVKGFYPPKSDVDDFMQIGLLGLLSAIRAHDPSKGKLSTIAWKAITNRLIRYTQKRKKQEIYQSDIPEYEYNNISMEELFDGISPQEREIILLKIESGNNFKQIGKLLGQSPQNVAIIYRNAINKIKS